MFSEYNNRSGTILAITLITFYYFCEVKTDKNELRIFQGRDAEQGEFPYVVVLAIELNENENIKYKTICTGSVITPVWTLTAAHCFPSIVKLLSKKGNESSEEKPVIRYVNLPNNSWLVNNIIRAVQHPAYIELYRIMRTTYMSNDVGLLETERTIISKLGKVSSVDFRTLYGQNVMAVGFGRMSLDGKIDVALNLNKSLQVFEGMIKKCSSILRPEGFCLASNCRKVASLCRGDSGGPVIHPTGIIGVNSLGNNYYCDKEVRYSGTITPISYYINWIKSVISGGS